MACIYRTLDYVERLLVNLFQFARFASSDYVEVPKEGALWKDYGGLYRHSKVCCEAPGRICSVRIFDASTTS